MQNREPISHWNLGPAWGNEFNVLSEWGKIREAFEGGFFDEAGLGCIEALMEFESREEYRGIQHQLEERWLQGKEAQQWCFRRSDGLTN